MSKKIFKTIVILVGVLIGTVPSFHTISRSHSIWSCMYLHYIFWLMKIFKKKGVQRIHLYYLSETLVCLVLALILNIARWSSTWNFQLLQKRIHWPRSIRALRSDNQISFLVILHKLYYLGVPNPLMHLPSLNIDYLPILPLFLLSYYIAKL